MNVDDTKKISSRYGMVPYHTTIHTTTLLILALEATVPTHLPIPSYTMLYRRVAYYSLLSSYAVDAYLSKAETMMHLTLWSWCLQILYFELPVPTAQENNSYSKLLPILHGPAFTGAHALFAMYLWTLYANPQMEYDLAPKGRPGWVILARAAWFHALPVVLQWYDLQQIGTLLHHRVYQPLLQSLSSPWKRYGVYFWMAVGGYFAMGLTWEQVNGDATGTYKVQHVSPETFVNVSKALGVTACVASFVGGFWPVLLQSDPEEDKTKKI